MDGRVPSKEIIADIAFACIEMKMIPDTQEETKHAEEKRILMEDLDALKSRINSIVPGLTEDNRKEIEGRFINLSIQIMRGISAEAISRKQAIDQVEGSVRTLALRVEGIQDTVMKVNSEIAWAGLPW